MKIRAFFPPIPGCGMVVAILWLLSFSLSGAVPGDEHWDNQFNWPGPSGNVAAIATHNGSVYVSFAATSTNFPIEVWDGLQWSTMAQAYGSGIFVYDLAFVGDTLYLAGLFTNVNGVAVTNLAKWDGTSWSSIGFNGMATVLAVDGNNLYVGGAFTNAAAGGLTVTNVGYWDGNAWHALGNGLGIYSGTSFGVNAIALKSGLVYAGGLFTNSGSLLMTNLAVWDGTRWSAVGGGANNNVFALAFNGGNLFAGGYFTQAGTTLANCIAQWDGVHWSALGSGVSGGIPLSSVFRLAVLNGSVYASGAFTSAGGVQTTNIAAWNDSSWSALGLGVSSSVARVFSTGTNLLMGGNFLLAGGIIANGLAAWDGSNWSTLGTPGRENGISSTVMSIGGSGTNLLIGGMTFPAAGQTNAIRIARFDGTRFYPVGPGLNSNVVAVAAVGTNYYAGGLFTGNGTGNGPLAYHMAHWDGTNWSSLNNTAFATVSRLAARGNDLFIAGYFGIAAANQEAWWLARWDGTNFWSVLNYPTNVTFNSMYFDNIGFSALAVDGTNIYASGRLTLTECDSLFNNCTDCVYAVHFDGTYAWPMGTGLNTNATAIAVVGTNVYFAGPFVTNAGGVTVSQIARWNGANWTDVGGGVIGKGAINALASVGTNLYAGGTFTNLGGITVSRIAKWDGTTWLPLGSGVSSTVSALYASGSDLFAGGNFRLAGNKPSYYLGRWNDQNNFNTPQLANPTWMTNKQFQVRLMGIGGLTNIIQASTNLSSWTPVLTNTAGIYDFIDPASATYPRRFYRALLGP
jgi:hypothetical protein